MTQAVVASIDCECAVSRVLAVSTHYNTLRFVSSADGFIAVYADGTAMTIPNAEIVKLRAWLDTLPQLRAA